MITNFAEIVFKNFRDAEESARAWRDQDLKERAALRQDVQLGFQADGNQRDWQRLDLEKEDNVRADKNLAINQTNTDIAKSRFDYEVSRRPFTERQAEQELANATLVAETRAAEFNLENERTRQRVEESRVKASQHTKLLTEIGGMRSLLETPVETVDSFFTGGQKFTMTNPLNGTKQIVSNRDEYYKMAAIKGRALKSELERAIPRGSEKAPRELDPYEADIWSQYSELEQGTAHHPFYAKAMDSLTAVDQAFELAPRLKMMRSTPAGRYALTKLSAYAERLQDGIPIPKDILSEALKIEVEGTVPAKWEDPHDTIKSAETTLSNPATTTESRIKAIKDRQQALASMGFSYQDYSTGSPGAYKMGPIESVEVMRGNFGAGTPKPDSKPGSIKTARDLIGIPK